ncbi:MAG: type II CAAX endopeptidase family protein [Candidatus Limnocylindria bacterium]
MPSWPGPTMAVVGALFALFSLGASAAALQGAIRVADPALLAWLAILGGVLFVAGLVYVAVRQLRVRRHLPPERYRGPAIPLLLLLVLVLATILTIPFTADAAALVLGEGELTFLGALVLLTATQAALLTVSWLLVFLPGALKALPAFPGPRPVAAIRAGLGWGAAAWLGSSVLAAGIAWALERAGFVVEPQTAEQAIAVVEPWVVIVAIVILAPVAEEVFFRGIVFNAWLRERGRRWAFIGSAVLFAVIHVSVVALVPILLLGLALAWIYARTGSLLAPIVMHATVNGISVALALLVRFEVIAFPA